MHRKSAGCLHRLSSPWKHERDEEDLVVGRDEPGEKMDPLGFETLEICYEGLRSVLLPKLQ